MISGTIRRSQRDCVETFRRVADGAIGDIVSAQVIRNGGTLWHKDRQPGWSDMEYVMRNWPNFCCISGDLLTEQFIHEIDMMSWFLGDRKPLRAIGYGGRQRRVTGDVYDFSVSNMFMTMKYAPTVLHVRSMVVTTNCM